MTNAADRLIAIDELGEMLGGRSRASIYRDIESLHNFPPSLKLGASTRFRVSAESIYRHAYSPAGRQAGLPWQLAQRKAKRGRRRRNGRRAPSIPNRVSIHQRPTKAHLRSQFGSERAI